MNKGKRETAERTKVTKQEKTSLTLEEKENYKN